MNRLLAVVLIGVCAFVGCEVTSESPGLVTDQQNKGQLCSWIIASHRSTLESLFEAELYAADYKTDEWHDALKSLGVATSDPSGDLRDPSSVLQSTIDKLVQVKNSVDRMRLEYLLLGSRISLEERRRFDDYCVAGTSLMINEGPETH
jgi:hypothetical protein